MQKLAIIAIVIAILAMSTSTLAATVADAQSVESISAIGMSCKKPFVITQDCSGFSGPKKKISFDGYKVKVAGSADGTVTVLMDTIGSIASGTVNVGYFLLKRALVERGFDIVRVTPVASWGSLQGYVIETTESSYHIWNEFLADIEVVDKKALIAQTSQQEEASAWPIQAMGEIVTTLHLKDELEWDLETDVGTMHFYGGGELWSVDLMGNGELLMDPIPLSGNDDPRTVRHISKTDMLLITSTRGDVEGQAAHSPSGDGDFSSAVNLFSGEFLWRKSPLDTPDEVHYFPDSRTVVLRSFPKTSTAGSKKPSNYTALDLDTGQVRWTHEYHTLAVWVNGPFLEVVGSKTVSLDALTGKEMRIVDLPLPRKTMLMAFPTQEKILTWRKKDFSLYEIPTLSRDEASQAKGPINVDAKKLWQMKTHKKLGEVQLGLNSGPKYVSDKLLLINSLSFVELINFESGESIWGRKKDLGALGKDMEVSPSLAYGAITQGKMLSIVDMNNGLDVAALLIPGTFKTANSQIVWHGDEELVVVFSDARHRPQNITRIDVADNSIVWTRDVDLRTKYRMTTKEKGKLTAGILLALAAVAVSVDNPVVHGNSANTGIYHHFVPNLNVKLLPDSSAELEALEASLEVQQNMALRRYLDRSKSISRILGKQGQFVTGEDNQYEIVNFDLDTGDSKFVGGYSAPKVHRIEADVLYGLVITHEDNRKKINVISLEAKLDY